MSHWVPLAIQTRVSRTVLLQRENAWTVTETCPLIPNAYATSQNILLEVRRRRSLVEKKYTDYLLPYVHGFLVRGNPISLGC